MAEVDARQLKEAIETQHGGTATLARSIPVLETFEEQPDRDGGSGAMSNVVRHTTCLILFLMLAGCLPE